MRPHSWYLLLIVCIVNLYVWDTKVSRSLKACIHLIHFNALPKPASSSKPSVLMLIDALGASTLFHLHIIWLQSTASGIPSSCFTDEKCNHAKDSWKNGSSGTTPTQACFIEKASVKAEEDTLCRNLGAIWEKFFKVYCCALLQV